MKENKYDITTDIKGKLTEEEFTKILKKENLNYAYVNSMEYIKNLIIIY